MEEAIYLGFCFFVHMCRIGGQEANTQHNELFAAWQHKVIAHGLLETAFQVMKMPFPSC